MKFSHSQILKFSKALLGLFSAGVIAAVVVTLERRVKPVAPPLVAVRTDPKAIVESMSGRAVRFNRAHEDIRVEYQRLITYADGSTKLLGIKVVAADRGDGRSFTLSGDEGTAGKDESVVSLTGHIVLQENDGFTVETTSATYDDRDGTVRAPGDIAFHRNRMSGSGKGLLYNKKADVLTVLERAKMHMAPNAAGKGAADVTAGNATFTRLEHLVDFEGGVHVTRAGQTIGAATAIVYLSDDDARITVLELHGNASIAGEAAAAGSLQGISGQDINAEYADDGQAIERAIIGGNAVVKLSGGAGKPGREIDANALDVRLADDGATPLAMIARQNVQLMLPADEESAARTVKAQTLVAMSDPEDPARGLTSAQFTGGVEYREKSRGGERVARSSTLDVGLKPGMSAFDSASFSGAARFEDVGKVTGTASSVKYLADRGTLALSSSERASPRPHVSNDQIAVDASTIDVTLMGPVLHAKGDVKSVMQPPKKKPGDGGSKLPSMLKQDQTVTVTADALDYDGDVAQAAYQGHAQLWQSETSIKGESIALDNKTGNLTASGSVHTATVLEQVDKDKKKQRVPSAATARMFTYDDKARRVHYEGDVHFSQSENDLAAATVDLYLKPEGNELDHAEAFDGSNNLVLREQGRRTTGSKLTFSTTDERYDVTGSPVTVTDQCGRVTNGRTLTFRKATDTIEMDGNRRVRTQTKNGTKCQ
jgi:lipopolysaccharide export system protein LptA